MHGHYEHDDVGMLALELAGRREAVHLRHADVHQHKVRMQAAAELDSFPAVRRFADYLQVRLAGQQAPEASPEKMVVVYDNEPRWRGTLLRRILILHDLRPPPYPAIQPQQLQTCRIPVRCGSRTFRPAGRPSRACRRGPPSRQDRPGSKYLPAGNPTLIPDQEADGLTRACERYVRAGGPRVLAHVREGLLRNAEKRRLHLGRQAAVPKRFFVVDL